MFYSAVMYEAINRITEVETNNVQLARDLWKAVQAEDVREVISLLERGADPNHPLHRSEESILKPPPLHLACTSGFLDIVKALVTHGAHKMLWDKKSPLNCAFEGDQQKVVDYLIQDDKERQSGTCIIFKMNISVCLCVEAFQIIICHDYTPNYL